METKEIKINCPEGFEVDKENSTFECIKFKPIKNKFPKTWEEFCKIHSVRKEEYWISDASNIGTINIIRNRDSVNDKNLLPNKKLAEAMLALCQLIQLRDCYNGNWKPDYQNTTESKYCITVLIGKVSTSCFGGTQKVLAFKTKKLRDQFFENFKDLIEIAKPLL